MRLIKHCLNQQLLELGQQAIQLEELSLIVEQLLPVEFAKTCQVGSFIKGCLMITTTNTAWASQLRYLLPQLRDSLRKEGLYQLSSIKIMVNESAAHYKKPILKEKIALTSKAKASIIQESQQCTYPPLQQALFKLADKNKD